jgi:hypothetical protein
VKALALHGADGARQAGVSSSRKAGKERQEHSEEAGVFPSIYALLNILMIRLIPWGGTDVYNKGAKYHVAYSCVKRLFSFTQASV